MPHSIEITSTTKDSKALVMLAKLQDLGFTSLKKLWLADVYTIDKNFTSKQLSSIAQTLTNPVTQTSLIDKSFNPGHFDWALEIGFLPGVTDNIGATTKQAIQDLLGTTFTDQENVYTSLLVLVAGKLTKQQITGLADSLHNPVIQRVHIKPKKEFISSNGMDQVVPRVNLNNSPSVSWINLNIDDQDLIDIGKKGILNPDGTRRGPLALDLTYMKAIQKYFSDDNRNPTDVELESIAQTWSEHCKHTIFNDPIDEIKDGLFNHYIRTATENIRKKRGDQDFCVSVFSDNAGAIIFDDDHLVCDKVETHNSPSALDPFGGSITGIVGVNRDIIGFGLGAKPVANRYGYCFGFPSDTTKLYRDQAKTQPMLSPKRILDGVIDGVNSGGNQSGIPTPQGFLYFDDNYKGKPLVFVGTLGLIPKKINHKESHHKKAQADDFIIVIGGRVGLDGIHGATFSSEALDSGSPATSVQIGDPITQKKLSDTLIREVRDQDLYNSITDNGAGGISCSVAEMAKESNGCFVNLDLVPLKYPGLDPWQIWISESQERMTLAVPPKNWKKFKKIMDKHDVEATKIGVFTGMGNCVVSYYGQTIMDVDLEFLHNGLPPRPMKTKKPKLPKFKSSKKQAKDYSKTILDLLAHPNISSFSFISTQYDHEVQGTSVLKPLQGRGQVNADATAIRPVLSSPKAIVISQSLLP